MNKVLANIKTFSIPFLIGAIVVLSYITYTLPERISKVLNIPVKDTVKITTIKTVNLQNSGNFIYLDCKVIGPVKRLRDDYTYDMKYPSEVYDGYVFPVQSQQGGKYFVWTTQDSVSQDKRITGFFMADNLSRFQAGKEYLQILFPIVKKNIYNDFIKK
jgi:hypothetical protein